MKPPLLASLALAVPLALGCAHAPARTGGVALIPACEKAKSEVALRALQRSGRYQGGANASAWEWSLYAQSAAAPDFNTAMSLREQAWTSRSTRGWGLDSGYWIAPPSRSMQECRAARSAAE